MSDHGTRPPARRRRAWVRDLPGALAGLAEGYLRDSMIIGTATLALIVAVGAALSGSGGLLVVGVLVGVGGAVLVLTGVARKWSLGKQWLTIAVVLAVEIAVIAVSL